MTSQLRWRSPANDESSSNTVLGVLLGETSWQESLRFSSACASLVTDRLFTAGLQRILLCEPSLLTWRNNLRSVLTEHTPNCPL